jgi:predicted dehydrogenase
MSDLTRRNFIKTAGTTAGVAVAAGWSPTSYAANEKVRVGLIGSGGQGRVHLEHGLGLSEDIEVVALADVRFDSLARGWKALGGDDEFKKHLHYDYRVMLEKEDLDAVVIVTPYKTHYDIVMDCLDAGLHVFCEKTMAHEIDLCRNIVKKVHETGKVFQVGHQRRYNHEYNHALKEMVEGRIGRVTYIEAQWHRNGDWRLPHPEDFRFSDQAKAMYPDQDHLINWRVYDQFSAGLMSELATHHLDAVNWMLGTMPTRVIGTGGIDYWRDTRDTYDNVNLTYEYDLSRSKHGFTPIQGRTDGEYGQQMMKINKPYTVRVNWSGSLMTRRKGASMMISGDTGTFEMRERGGLGPKGCVWHDEGSLWYLDDDGKKITDEAEIYRRDSQGRSPEKELILEEPIPFEREMAASAFDEHSLTTEMKAFAKHIKHGGKPRTNEMCGLMAAIDDIAGLEAMKTGQTVEIKPEWYEFDFETPNPFMYEGNDETPA